VTILLDANVLIALVVADHVHHDAAEKWLEHIEGSFATCPITQGSLVRFLVRKGQPVDTATSMVAAVAANPRHDFWPDEVSYLDVSLRGVIGHRQVADAYLAGLARARSGRLATFDQGMSKLHRDIVELVPTRDV
jgi:toxin-antitoxin system PIN domain toxin